MNVTLTQYTVTALCEALNEGKLQVNYDYQRSPRVWPVAARSFLIETILLGYPIPKLYLTQITDLKSKKSRQEIVDGQQRTMAVKDYFDNKFSLVKNALPEHAAGKTFDQLDDDLKGKFLSYPLTADLFIGATPEDIREMFRRMNSYTVPLNAEERRHAEFQGACKWFVYRMTKRYAQALEEMGAFTEKSLARMQDARLMAEFSYAILHGIQTTKGAELRRMYADKDKSFPEEKQLEKRLSAALDALIEMRELHRGPLMKPYQLYALLLALTHARSPVGTLTSEYTFSATKLDRATIVQNLTTFAAALDDPETAPKQFKSLLLASQSKTNVGDQRRIRFVWMCKALDNEI